MDESALEWIAETIVGEVARGQISAAAAAFLVRLYAIAGDEGVRDALAAALTRSLDAGRTAPDPRDRIEWLGVLADAAAIVDDERVATAVHESLAGAIDDLEAYVRAGYEPGEGVIGASVLEQLRTAAALVTAFELTARLPYSMLAEELLQFARPHVLDAESGALRGGITVNCLAARILCRVAAFHRDPDYTASAVVANHAQYPEDAARIVAALAGVSRAEIVEAGDAASYGLALLDYFALNAHPN